jgi:hypothetical protein
MTRRTLLAILAVLTLGCRHPILDPAARSNPRPKPGAEPAPGNNWSLPPAEAERLLARAPMKLLSIEPTAAGVAGAYKGEVAFRGDGRRAQVKWKRVPGDLDGWNNNPRKELATYAVQGWFLAPRDYVVPTIVLRCVPLAAYRRLDPQATATIEGTRCVLGTLSPWLRNVEVPEVLYDPARFAADTDYAYHLANFNVLAYLVEHRDGRPGNILVADDDDNRRVFAVDNGISFGGLIHNFLTTNWDVIRVPAIPLEDVARLRALDPAALESLAVLVDLRADAKGILRPGPLGPPLDAERGVRLARGRVQMGLTTEEIGGVRRRIAALLKQVDDGTLKVF